MSASDAGKPSNLLVHCCRHTTRFERECTVSHAEAMTLLPPQAIDEFQALWKKRYGVELPREQAIVRAHQVYTLVRMVVEDFTPLNEPTQDETMQGNLYRRNPPNSAPPKS